jgi:hypothetical protein
LVNALPPKSCSQNLRSRDDGRYSKGSGSVSSGGPFPASVESESFVTDDFEEAATAEGFRIGLTFNFEDIKREEEDFSYSNQTEKLEWFECERGTFRLWHGV